jgi:DNA excision repair protein ERCC-4
LINYKIDLEDFKVENSLFRSFDSLVRNQLECVWHQASTKTKQLVDDLKTLRLLIKYLVHFDPIVFYSFLETTREANILTATTLKNHSSWLLMDAANVVFSNAKSRLYGKNGSENPEIPPKWKAILAILNEIEDERLSVKSNVGNSIYLVDFSFNYRS